MLVKTQLPCCAMCFLSSTTNKTTKEEIESFINKLKKEAFAKPWLPTDRRSGERTILTVSTPSEVILKQTLKKVGFKELDSSFKRRFGYPEGELTLHSYQF